MTTAAISAKELAGALGIRVEKTTPRRRRAEGAIRRLAACCRNGNRTNRVRCVYAQCTDIARLWRADQAAFARFIREVLDET